MDNERNDLIQMCNKLAEKLQEYADEDEVANANGYGTFCTPSEFIGDVLNEYKSLMDLVLKYS